MACYMRPMRKEDIPQVLDIDREAFPTQLPPPNFQHELRNRLAHYIVACDGERTVEPPPAAPSPSGGLSGLLSRLGGWLGVKSDNSQPVTGHYIIGFIGFWAMADEAHITSIAVREGLQRQGIGELLLISTIEMARELKASAVTLEVRASNKAAQSLYSKLGFNQTGVRKGYYTDNREDGIVMTTDDINSRLFQAQLKELKKAHHGKWGTSASRIVTG